MDGSHKARGAFYTPKPIVDYLTRWAIRSPADRVLDPGCGDGAFLQSACERLASLGAGRSSAAKQVWGIEINEQAKTDAESLLVSNGHCATVVRDDFFRVDKHSIGSLDAGEPLLCDVVVGNPPYIRYHGFAGDVRRRGLERARDLGVTISGLASSWAPYLVHAVSFLAPGGRLAMVLPAELMNVDYAEPIRRFLLRRFESLYVITFVNRVFPGVEEEVVLLLAEDNGTRRGLTVVQVEDASTLPHYRELEACNPHRPSSVPRKWLTLLLPRELTSLMARLEQCDLILPLRDFAEVDVGVVTGNKDYFLLSDAEARQWGLTDRWLVPCVSKASHIRGCIYTHRDHDTLRASGVKSSLLRIEPKQDVNSDATLVKYLEQGEAAGVNSGYKCQNRKPWYSVPAPRMPDAFLTYMAGDQPRLALNERSAHNTNTIHSVFFKSGNEELNCAVVVAFANSLSMLSAELCGRSYGGGVLKLETKEAESVLMPNLHKMSRDQQRNLAVMLAELDASMRSGQNGATRAGIDEVILRRFLHLTAEEVNLVTQGLASLKTRRRLRGTRSPSPAGLDSRQALEPVGIAV